MHDDEAFAFIAKVAKAAVPGGYVAFVENALGKGRVNKALDKVQGYEAKCPEHYVAAFGKGWEVVDIVVFYKEDGKDGKDPSAYLCVMRGPEVDDGDVNKGATKTKRQKAKAWAAAKAKTRAKRAES